MAPEAGGSPGPLLSSLWYRVGALRPKLRSHAALYRHRYRGQVWYLLRDAASGRVHRFTPSARLVIALLDGRRTVGEVWEIASRRLQENAPTQDEIIQLLGQLHAADLLQSDVTPDVAELFERSEREETARQRRSYGNPLALRIPLWDPETFLNRFERPIRLIWSAWGAFVWLAVVLPALLLVFSHWQDLTNDFTDRVLAYDNLAALYFVFPFLKTLHELGHASATKSRGGEVHELGLMMLVLLPVPYVEASASAVFKSKYERALVGVAGVAVEVFIAALAFYLWLLIEPGLVRAVLFNVMLIAGVSTLIFNGNPLLRYDGYYVLADLIEMPNLAGRSLQFWGYLVERYLLGVRDADTPDASRGEKAWFAIYGICSSLYRVLMTVVIALFIAQKFFVVGILLAVWGLAAMALFPIIRGLRSLLSDPRLVRRRSRSLALSAGAVLLVLGLLLGLPVPDHSQVEGVMWLPDSAIVRAGEDGYLAQVIVPPETRVTPGEALLRLSNTDLDAQWQESAAKLAELKAEYAAELPKNIAKADAIRAEFGAAEMARSAALRRVANLVARAGTRGRFVLPDAADMPGRYYRKGDLLGYVIGPAPAIARVVVPQADAERVRFGTERVLVRPVDRIDSVFEGKIVREVPGGEEDLPSLALGSAGGGQIATDPRDPNAAKALQRMFQFDVALPSAAANGDFGQRVFVRFDYRPAPLVQQWYRSLRLLFLSMFNV